MNVKRYLFDKLIFPKVVMIDKPGIIVNKTSNLYESTKKGKRILFFFEEHFIDLQKKTIEKIGPKKSSLLYYKIGKDSVTRHLISLRYKKIPPFLIQSFLKKACESLFSAGITMANQIKFNKKHGSFIIKGKNNIICRKTQDASFFAGIISGLISCLTDRNIETKIYCQNCPDECKIIAHNKFEEIYIPNLNEFSKNNEFSNMNFQKKTLSNNFHYSFKDLIKFKKIHYDNHKHYFENMSIMPSEFGMTGLFYKNYKKIEQLEILKTILIESGEKVGAKVFISKDTNKNINHFKKILCAFGWGIPFIDISKSKIYLRLISAPITDQGFIFEASILNGYLNYILNSKYEIKNISIENNSLSKINILFSKKKL